MSIEQVQGQESQRFMAQSTARVRIEQRQMAINKFSIDNVSVLEPKKRFIISKMILNNFKSYFGKQEIGPFHKESENLDASRIDVYFEEILDLPDLDNYEILPQSQLSFKESGIDLDHKRFLILKGEVEFLSQMKPKVPNEHEDDTRIY
ncbi:14385_t:CDS:2 [Funneliformis caledonium]|uniref:14385_t:CDS:1 n=1 Tax=Funneliformis caledonium TaxID=1117310 RepID=A0A9N9A633_9GLOM|nr:14385_t:CDS:2 [Funneliformis caledonium]